VLVGRQTDAAGEEREKHVAADISAFGEADL
jgi:hypothetical protein